MTFAYRLMAVIHSLQARTETITERAAMAAQPLSLPRCVSRTPRHGTAVTPRHAVFSWHFPLEVGGQLRFGDGPNLERREITSVVNIGGDIGVASWRSPIQAEPMRVLPWDWTKYIPTQRDQMRLREPIIAWRGDREHGVHRTPLTTIGNGLTFAGVSGPILPGDSGSPVFLNLEQPVMLGCVSSGIGGTNLLAHWTVLNEATGWLIKEADWWRAAAARQERLAF